MTQATPAELARKFIESINDLDSFLSSTEFLSLPVRQQQLFLRRLNIAVELVQSLTPIAPASPSTNP